MRRYTEDYEIEIIEDAKGKEKTIARYRGNYYETVVDERDLIRFKRFGLLLTVVIIALHVGAGFIANRGMIRFYVSLPYVITFLPLYFLAAGMLRLPAEKRKFRRDEVHFSFDRVRTASIFLLILVGVSIIGELVFLIGFATENLPLEYAFLGIEILAMVASYGLFRMQKPIRIEESITENESIP